MGISTPEINIIIDKLIKDRGFDFSGYRTSLLERRILKRIQTLNLNSSYNYITYLENNSDELDNLIDVLTINVSSFFRNPFSFEYIEQKREELIEAIADFDEDLMMKYLEGEEIGIPQIKAAIRKGTLAVKFFPVICGSSFKNKGVKLVLDAVIAYLPSPLDVAAVTGTAKNGEEVVLPASDDEKQLNVRELQLLSDKEFDAVLEDFKRNPPKNISKKTDN